MRKMDTNKCWWGQEGTGLLIHSSWEQAHTPFLHMYVFAVCAFAHAYSVHIHICVNVRRPEGDGNLPLSLFHPTLWDRVSRSSLGLVVLTSLTSQLTQGFSSKIEPGLLRYLLPSKIELTGKLPRTLALMYVVEVQTPVPLIVQQALNHLVTSATQLLICLAISQNIKHGDYHIAQQCLF